MSKTCSLLNTITNGFESMCAMLREPFIEASSERFTDAEVGTARTELSDFFSRTICDPEKTKIWSDTWLEQYKLIEQSTETIVNRRQEMHKFFMASLTALLAGSLILVAKESVTILGGISLCFVGTIGFLLTLVWHRLYGSYCRLIKRKLLLIEALESFLPLPLNKLQHDLHEIVPTLSNNESEKKFKAISDAERMLPALFGYLSLMVFIAGVLLMPLANSNQRKSEEIISRVDKVVQANADLSSKTETVLQAVELLRKDLKLATSEQDMKLERLAAESRALGATIGAMDKRISTLSKGK